MAQFKITKGPGSTELMFALFDRQYLRTVKFTVMEVPHEIEVTVTGIEHSRKDQKFDSCWIVHGRTVEETPAPVLCYFFMVQRDGTMFIDEDAEKKRLWRAQHPESFVQVINHPAL